jgi:hypothetical protein
MQIEQEVKNYKDRNIPSEKKSSGPEIFLLCSRGDNKLK